jgi:hypothetical protein
MKINDQEIKLKNGKIRLITEEFGHSYWHDEMGWVAGVTTILGEALPTPIGLKLYWQNMERSQIEMVLEKAKNHGSKVHQFIEQLNKGEVIQTADEPRQVKADIASYVEWFRAWQPDNIIPECVVFHHDGDMRFAGTVDMVFEQEKRNVLLDIKTANQVGLSAFLQVAAYAQAYEKSYGIKIDDIVILQLGTAHKKINMRTPIFGKPSNGVGWKVYQIDRNLYNFEAFTRIYDTWILLNEGYPTPPKVVEYPSTFQLWEAAGTINNEEIL